MTEDCAICLIPLEEDKCKLSCGHEFHGECMGKLYSGTINRYDEMTGTALQPRCPLCRKPFAKSQLPKKIRDGIKEPVRRTRALSTDSIEDLVDLGPIEAGVIGEDEEVSEHSLWGSERVIYNQLQARNLRDSRPLRLNRQFVLINRSRIAEALNGLVSARERLNRGVAANNEPVAGPSGLRRRVIFEPSSTESSQASQNREQSQKSNRSRSTISPTIQRVSTDLRDMQIQISIYQSQLQQIDDESGHRVDLNTLTTNENEDYEDDSSSDSIMLEPIEILGTWGRGRHSRYRVGWSDHSVTLNRTTEVERVAPGLLEYYRREQRRLATQRTRENQKNGIAPKIPGRGRGRGRGPGTGRL